MGSRVLGARHVHALLHRLALEGLPGPWASLAGHLLGCAAAALPAAQAPQRAAAYTCSQTERGLHLPQLQVGLHLNVQRTNYQVWKAFFYLC